MSCAYDESPTFRRLFNYAYDTNLRHGDKWYLSTQNTFSTTVTAEDIEAENGKKLYLLIPIQQIVCDLLMIINWKMVIMPLLA